MNWTLAHAHGEPYMKRLKAECLKTHACVCTSLLQNMLELQSLHIRFISSPRCLLLPMWMSLIRDACMHCFMPVPAACDV
jgi:hypothetical protein